VIDTSPLYGLAEEIVGHAAATAGIQDHLYVTNKIWSTGAHLGDESHAETSLRNSMRRLSRTAPIDVMQCHALVNVDMIVPLLHAWKAEGRIHRLGITHHDPAYFGPMATWIQNGDVDFVQTRYSIAQRSAEQHILPLAAERGVAVTVNMPLEKGRLHHFVGNRPLPDIRTGYRDVGAVFPQVGDLASSGHCRLAGDLEPRPSHRQHGRVPRSPSRRRNACQDARPPAVHARVRRRHGATLVSGQAVSRGDESRSCGDPGA
jgi:aryl-alcohol dehydrogenase-like predicted oxidoreductase